MAKEIWSWFFTVWHCFSPRCAFWHTAVCLMHSLFILSVSHSLCYIHLCWQQNVLSTWCLPLCNRNHLFFIVTTLISEVYFLSSSWFVLLCNRLTGTITFFWREMHGFPTVHFLYRYSASSVIQTPLFLFSQISEFVWITGAHLFNTQIL